MKLKLDENLGERGRKMLATAGHDVSTVTLQRLESAPDEAVIEACRREGLVLVTLDWPALPELGRRTRNAESNPFASRVLPVNLVMQT